MVLVLGQIRQVRKVAECTDDMDRVVARERVEGCLELAAGVEIVVAPEAHRALAHSLDQVEYGITLAVAHGVAEHASEQSYVLPQWLVLVLRHDVSCRSGGFVGG